ncbi:MAG TPA: RluA family pseudouridine synthase [Candidatus Polarisedimenticolia bacterium]|nr:RluA family pseudouridine synthase [Candidatus Polarisedimenticolia bacterium]
MARRLELVVEDPKDLRLDRYLQVRLPEQSRAAIQRLIAGGHVLLSGKPARAATRVRAGDPIVIEFPDPPPEVLVPEPIPLQVVHEDPAFFVISKPAGLVVHPGAGRRTGTLVHALLSLGGELSTAGGAGRPGIVHRLDRETSGLLVVARTDAAHRSLAAQFEARKVLKLYDALVWGRIAPARGRIDAPLGRHPVARTRMAVRATGRAAITEYASKEAFSAFTLLEVRILTGRTHQIRVHMKHLGHPIVGDTEYGGARTSSLRDAALREEVERFGRLALHARRLEFAHPETGEPLRFEAPLPGDFADLLEALRGRR